MTTATGFDGNYLGGTLNDNLDFVEDKSESKIIKEYGDLPPPDENDEIILDKDNFRRWQFAADIVLPQGVTIFRKGVTVEGVNDVAGLRADSDRALFRGFDGQSETTKNMRLQNTALNGSIFDCKQNSLVLNDIFSIYDCDIIECNFIGPISGYGQMIARNVRVYGAANGGLTFGTGGLVPVPPPFFITLDNVVFLDDPITSGDCITIDATAAQPSLSLSVDTVSISNSKLYSPSGFSSLKVVNQQSVRLIKINNPEFLGDGANLEGLQRNTTGVEVIEVPYYAIYHDTLTQSTPINALHGVWTKITNNKNTEEVNLPLRIPSLWNNTANKIDLTGCEVGEMLVVAVIIDVESNKIQTTFSSRLLGLDTAATVVVGKAEFMNQINIGYNVGLRFDLPITSQDQIDNGFEIQINPSDPNNSDLIIKVHTISITRA
jgi:hypothetical protein